MGAFLDKPNTRKFVQDGQIIIPARNDEEATGGGSPGAAAPPAAYLIRFGGSSMQG